MAGASAVASGLAYVAYFFGGFPETHALDHALWNLLIIPTALYVGLVVARRAPIFTILLGVAAAIDFAHGRQRTDAGLRAGRLQDPTDMVWSVWLGAALLRDPTLDHSSPDAPRAVMP